MIMWRKTHESELHRLADERLSETQHWESRVSDLKSQIEDLRRLIFVAPQKVEAAQYEVDAVISGSDKPFQISEEEHARLFNEAREIDLLISGNYAEDLVQ